MTTTRVAERAGVSVGSLYQYFSSKDALLQALLERKLGSIAAALERAARESAGLPLQPRVRRLMQALLAVKAENAELGAELARQAPRLEKQGSMQKMTASARALVRALLEAHEHEIACDDIELASFMVVHAVSGVVDAAVLGESPLRYDDPDLLERLTALCLHLVGAL